MQRERELQYRLHNILFQLEAKKIIGHPDDEKRERMQNEQDRAIKGGFVHFEQTYKCMQDTFTLPVETKAR